MWALTPQQSIERECARRGRADLVDGCVRLIVGQDVDPALLLALGGPAAEKFLDGEEHADTYWLRVWGVRGLLWAGDLSQLDAVRTALADESWRVRELAAKVVARHLMDAALDRVVALRDDPVARVRAAATRAVEVLIQADA